MAWSGKRPLTPNPATHETIEFHNHGLMYVSQADLDFSHFFVASGVIFAVIGVPLVLLHKVMFSGESPPAATSFQRSVGTIAQCAFIACLPFWLFANPYTALATAFDNPEHLLLADIATGALMVGWGLLMEHGFLFSARPADRERW